MQRYNISTSIYEKRVIVFIDILGFSEFIRVTPFNIVLHLMKDLNNLVSDGSFSTNGKAWACEAAQTLFSDTIVCAFPAEPFLALGRDSRLSDIHSDSTAISLLFRTQLIVANIQALCLEHGLLTRGSVSYGDVYHNENQWFGPAIIDAAEYEKKAKFPRVILADSFSKIVESSLNVALFSELSILNSDRDGVLWFNSFGFLHIRKDIDYIVVHSNAVDVIERKLIEIKDGNAREKWLWFSRELNRYTNEKLKKFYNERARLVKISS